GPAPEARWAARHREPQELRSARGGSSTAAIDRVVAAVHGNGMRVPLIAQVREGGGVAGCHFDPPLDLEVAEDPVVRLARVFLSEEAEEEEPVASPDAAVRQMRLRRTALAEQAGAVRQEHRVVVAEIVRTEPPPAGAGCMLAKPQRTVSRARMLG